MSLVRSMYLSIFLNPYPETNPILCRPFLSLQSNWALPSTGAKMISNHINATSMYLKPYIYTHNIPFL